MHEIVLAYIDPGMGSMLLQFAIGSLVGAVFFFRRAFLRVAGMLTGGSGGSSSVGDNKSNDSNCT